MALNLLESFQSVSCCLGFQYLPLLSMFLCMLGLCGMVMEGLLIKSLNDSSFLSMIDNTSLGVLMFIIGGSWIDLLAYGLYYLIINDELAKYNNSSDCLTKLSVLSAFISKIYILYLCMTNPNFNLLTLNNAEEAHLFYSLFVYTTLVHTLISLKISNKFYTQTDRNSCKVKYILISAMWAVGTFIFCYDLGIIRESFLQEFLFFILNSLFSATFYYDLNELKLYYKVPEAFSTTI